MSAQCPEPPAICQWPFQHPSTLPAASSALLTSAPPHHVDQMKEGHQEVVALTMGMDRAVSTATSLHHRKPHSHTCSCFLGSVTQMFSLFVHRATLTGHTAVETHNHTPIHSHEATQPHKLSTVINLVCLESHAQITQQLAHNITPLDSQPTCGSSAAPATAIMFMGHTPSSLSDLPVPLSLGAWCKEHAPSWVTSPHRETVLSPPGTTPLSRHMAITSHTPPSTEQHSQLTRDLVLTPEYLPTQSPSPASSTPSAFKDTPLQAP